MPIMAEAVDVYPGHMHQSQPSEPQAWQTLSHLLFDGGFRYVICFFSSKYDSRLLNSHM